MAVPMAFWTALAHLKLYLCHRVRFRRLFWPGREILLVVWVLASNLAELLHDSDLFLDSILNLRNQRRICSHTQICQLLCSTSRLGKKKKLTASAGRRVHARKKTLGGGGGALQALDYLREVITDSGLFIDLLLQVGEDGRVEEGGFGRHYGRVERMDG
jgi:hypothetical protein